MGEPRTATRWAWDTLLARSRGGHRIQAPHRLTLLAAADLLDRAAQAAGREMFDPVVLDQTVTGFDAGDLAARVGVTDRTAVLYCRELATRGLLQSRPDGRHFTLPASAWTAATETT